MMGRIPIDAATEITIAWINTLGYNNLEAIAKHTGKTQTQIICDFYRAIFQTVTHPSLTSEVPPISKNIS